MEHTTYGSDAAWVVLDEDGKLVVDNVYNGFDEAVQKQIKEYLNPVQNITEPQKQEKPHFENCRSLMRTESICEVQR